MSTSLGVGVAVIAITTVVGLRLRSHRRKVREQENKAAAKKAKRAEQFAELDRLLTRAATGVWEALNALKPYEDGWTGGWWAFVKEHGDEALITRYKQTVAVGYAKWHYTKYLEPLTELFQVYVATSDTADKINALLEYLKARNEAATNYAPDGLRRIDAKLGLSGDEAVAKLNKLLAAQLAELLDLARTGSRDAFLAAEALVNETLQTAKYHNRFRGQRVVTLARPQDWNDLVVRYHRTPRLEQFATAGLETRDYVGLAADAVQNNDAVTAQMAIAACTDGTNSATWVRDQMGDVLFADIALIASRAWAA
jgi:hypothetical protein